MVENQIRMTLKPAFRVKVSDRRNFFRLKFAVRDKARNNELYFSPIRESMTVTHEGEEINVDNFGRWLFGVPGFAGHWKNSFIDENGYTDISLPDIKEAKELIGNALLILKKKGVIEEMEEINVG